MNKYLSIIGRAETIDIIDCVTDVPAKIDTGAYRSSIHATDIRTEKDDSGKPILRFKVLGHPMLPSAYDLSSNAFSKVQVTSSNGDSEERYEVKLKISLGGKTFTTSFSLADRTSTVFPVLIGRRALKNRFLVDVSKTSVDRSVLLKSAGINEARDAEDLEDDNENSDS